ncbi:unnamed protein product [Adineta ricciae]|uniref:Uncharacterized protein n=1 Tax=Adineta ricciae TaxID=249248 RepID=A0A815LYB7_ADIRI|nr:unnamed protein product [Adineta ricciae]CAF1416431.1 unnamed protein product [Adineta ricciae]
MNRRKGKAEKETFYSSLFRSYTYPGHFVLYFINECTTVQETNELLFAVKNTTNFCIDTEGDQFTNRPALMQLAFIPSDNEQVVVLLVEVRFLPTITSQRFLDLQKLFQHIFCDGNHIFCWGDPLEELKPLLQFSLFSLPNIEHSHNVQGVFSSWFNSWLHSKTTAVDDAVDDRLEIHAPDYDPMLFLPPHIFNEQKMITRALWSLQDAVAYVLERYLSKRETLQKWSIGLDYRLSNQDSRLSLHHRNNMISYATNDVLSLTQLILFMYNSSNFIPHLAIGEYFILLKSKCMFSISSLVKQKDQGRTQFVLSDLESDCDEELAVHGSNERQVPSFSSPLMFSVLATTSTFNDLATVDVHRQCFSTTRVDPISLSPQMLIEQVPATVVSSQSTDHCHFDVAITRKKRQQKNRRSTKARKRRNQKTSSRHRRNRYQFVIQRESNLDVTTVKNILRQLQIKPTNVNPVHSIMFIGIKSHREQQYYEQLLPFDIFL